MRRPHSDPQVHVHGDAGNPNGWADTRRSAKTMTNPSEHLDVKRLAKAMKNASELVYHGTDDPVDWEAEAERIAAEYASLAPQERRD